MSATLKSGRVTMTFVDAEEQTPLDGAQVMLFAAYPDARPHEARTDGAGRVTFDVRDGSYLLGFNQSGLGLIEISPRGRWSDCRIQIPPDYPALPAGRPFLEVRSDDHALVLRATRDEPAETPPHPAPDPVDHPGDRTTLDQFLQQGLIREGLAFFSAPSNSEDQFSLAWLQAVEALHDFAAGLNLFAYRQDLDELLRSVPFLQMAEPGIRRFPGQQATPEAIGTLFRDLRDALQRANRTAAMVEADDFKVEVNLSKWRLPGNGHPASRRVEPMLDVWGPLFDLPVRTPAGDDIIVRFDAADAKWLEGYTHVLIGLLEIILAYDWQPLWDHAAHLLFVHYYPEPPIVRVGDPQAGGEWGRWADVIAALHAWRLEPADPEGVARGRDALLAMIECSRASWARILAETDDDLEWIPSPSQTGPAGTRITQAEVDGWLAVLDEWEQILRGGKLIPHWRFLPDRGVNVDALVRNPPFLDPVWLFQGHALVPYVEVGPVSGRDEWMERIAPFGGNFIRFGVWVN